MRRFLPHTILFLGLLLSPFQNIAQEYLTNITTVGVEDGLLGRNVLKIFEDSRGLIWIVTTKGVNCFDGENFKYFFEDKKRQNAPSCTDFVEDIHGNIWNCYFQKDNSSKYHYLIDKYFQIQVIDEYFAGKMPFKASEIDFIRQLEGNVLYFTTTKGEIYRYDGSFTLVIAHSDYMGAMVSKRNKDNELILITDKGLEFFSSSDSLERIIELPSTGAYLGFPSSKYPWKFPFLKEGIFIAAVLDNGFPTEGYFAEHPELTTKFDLSIHYQELEGKNLFILRSKDLLVLLDENWNLIYDFSKKLKNANKNIFPGKRILLRKNQIWFNTNKGFCILDYQLNPFKHYFSEESDFSTRSIFHLSNGNLLINSHAGVVEINEETEEVKTLLRPKSPFFGTIETIDSTLIFGNYGSVVTTYSPKNKKEKLIHLIKKDSTSSSFLIPFQDSQKNIWVGSTKGLVAYDVELKSLVCFKQYNEFEHLANKTINYFFEDEEGMWMATSDGLYTLDTDLGVTAFYAPLPQLDVQHFYREGDIFWLASSTHGLVKWNKKNNQTKTYDNKQGMLDDYIMAVYPDSLGNLWLTSEMGLIQFNKKNEKVQTFLDSDGITHNEFNRSSHYQSPDGRLYFGGLQGVTAFYPKDIYREAEEKSKLIVTNYYELNSEKGLFEDKMSTYLKQGRIILSPDIQSFRIHFALLNYKNIKQNRYLYQIEKLEEDWTIQKEPFIRINQLPYGEYTLNIKAKDYTGQDAEAPLTIPIEVLAPFYRKTSWQIVIFALFILSTYFFVKWRIDALQKEKKKLAQLVAQRTTVIENQKQELEQINQTKDRLFAILAHDLRQPLHSFKNLSKSIYYLLKNDDKNRLDKLIKYLEKESGQLYHLLDNLLHWALAQRDELTIEPITLDLCETVESVLEYHRPLANRLGVELLNEVAPETLLKADKRVLETVFRNLISNALRYTSKGTGWIKIAAFYRNNTVQIKVSDNGKGIRPEKLNNLFNLTTNKTNISLGLHLCKEMITLLDGNISVESQINMGTTFSITLPSKQLVEKINT